MTDIKMKELVALGKELNELMQFEEDESLPIKVGTRKTDLDEEIRKMIILLEPDDKLTVEATETLEKMGIDVEAARTEVVEENVEEEIEEKGKEKEKVEENNLLPTEQDHLQELELSIERNLSAFYEVGSALLEIRDSRLYRESYSTFEKYCKDRWDMSRPRAYQLIESATVKENLSTIVDIQSEGQTRPLTKLKTKQLQQRAMKKAIKSAPEGKVTAKYIAVAVDEIMGIELKELKKEAKPSDNFYRIFNSFYKEIQKIQSENWEAVSKKEVIKSMKSIQVIIEM